MITDKIQEAKECFQKMKQSGRNNFQNFDYFETKDIFPVVREVCRKFGMKTKFDWDVENQVMTLTITDTNDGTTDVSRIPVAPVTASDPGKYMQDVGRIQTYAQRYLYIQVFEISVPDDIDNRDQKKMQQKTVKKAQKTVTKKTEEPATEPEPTKEDIKKALDHVYYLISGYGGKEFTEERAIFQLGRQYKNKPKLVKACKESLKVYTADKLRE